MVFGLDKLYFYFTTNFMFKYLFYSLALLFSTIANSQSVGFNYQNASGNAICSPATINFTQTCTGNFIGLTWYFGNGQTSNVNNPSIVFTAGSYNVKLVAVFDNQVLETTQTIVVNPSISASLTADKNYICLPGNINFTATNTGNVNSYQWDFGDGTTQTTTINTLAHTYNIIGSYNAIVKAIDISGCSATASYNISLKNPPITASVSPTNGCAPINANFSANVLVPIGSSVTNYAWSFGDGSATSNTNIGSTLHPYTDSGTYQPTLSITTSEGCSNTYNFQNIAYGIAPINEMAYSSKTVYCGNETAMFVSKATYANAYKWDFGDGTITRVTDTLTTHKYSTLGIKPVKVTPYFNGCAGVPINFNINIVGVIASFTLANTCAAKKTFNFTNTSQGNQTTTIWNFGDGSPTVATPNSFHTYSTNAVFLAKLFITDAVTGCSDTATNPVYTASPTLVNNDTFVCHNATTIFTIPNNYTSGAVNMNWNILGLAIVSNNQNPFKIQATNFGNFTNNNVIISLGAGYCSDTLYLNHPISVRGPQLSFILPADTCATKKVLIKNASNAYLASDTVKLWYWNYGISNTINDTIYQPLPIQFNAASTYIIKLVAKDINGCTDSLSKSIIVKATPFLRIFPRGDTICLGKKDSLTAFHSDSLLWIPIPLVSCSRCDTTIASAIISTTFFATATNSLGCSITDSIFIKVYTPFTASASANPIYVCQNDTVRLSALPFGKKIIWNPASNLNDSTIYNPTAVIKNSNNFFAILTDSLGCFSSTANVNVIAKSLPTVNAGLDRILPNGATFTLTPNYSGNVSSYNWSPSGNLSCTSCPNPSGTAIDAQTYTIQVTSDSGCIAKDDITVLVECKYANLFMPSAFSPNNFSTNNVYYPLTRGIKLIKHFAIFNRYGQLMFEANNIEPNKKTFGWDGKFKSIEQPSGGYVYILEAICYLDEIITKKDSFILLR